VIPSQREHRPATQLFGDVAQEQSVIAPIPDVGRERCGRAPTQLKIQTKITDDFLREQTDQIRIAGQTRVVIGEYFLRSGCSADVIVPLQQKNTQPGSPQITRCDQPVMAGSKNDDIVTRFHFEFTGKFMLTSKIKPLTSNIS